MRYEFLRVGDCNMCGSTRSRNLGIRLNNSQGRHPKRVSGIAVTVKQCRDCGLIYPDPMPVPNRIEDHYGIPPDEYWNTDEALAWSADYFAREIARAKALLPFRPGMRALDIGAGLGKGMRSLANAGFDTWGIEPSEPFYRHALRNVPADRLHLSTLEDAGLGGQRFEFITFGAVLEHMFDPSEALRKAFSMAAPGAIIHLEVPSSNWLIARLVDTYFRLSGTNYTTHLSPMHTPFHLYEFTFESFRRNGRRLGYEVAEKDIQVCDVMHVPRVAKPLFRRIMEATGTGMQMTLYLRANPQTH